MVLVKGSRSLPSVGPKEKRRTLSATVIKKICPTISSAQKCGSPNATVSSVPTQRLNCCPRELTILYAMKGVPERHFSQDIKGDHLIPFCHVHPIKTDAASDSGYERIDNFGNNVFLLLQCLG